MADHRARAEGGTFLDGPRAPKRPRYATLWRLFRGNRLALLGLVCFVAFFLSATAGLVLTSGNDPVLDPSLVRLPERLRPPLAEADLDALGPGEAPPLGVYLLGTDDLGRDIFARMLQGAWVSLTVGFVAVGISVLIGILLGGLAGYYGTRAIRVDQLLAAGLAVSAALLILADRTGAGLALLAFGGAAVAASILKRPAPGGRPRGFWPAVWFRNTVSVDTVVMRFVDIMLCFPSFFLILTVVALLPASIYNIMIIIGLTSWMGTTRFVRAEFLSLREQDFVSAARVLGLGDFRIIFRHMMPNAVAPVLVSATIGIATAILTEAGLSFLGFGVPPPHATWGNILSDGKRFIFDAPWLTFIPGTAILIVVLSFNLFGEGLRDALNPKLEHRQ